MVDMVRFHSGSKCVGKAQDHDVLNRLLAFRKWVHPVDLILGQDFRQARGRAPCRFEVMAECFSMMTRRQCWSFFAGQAGSGQPFDDRSKQRGRDGKI